MPWDEQATLLVRKARQDEVIVRLAVHDPDISDEVAGFHAQQACEKILKAVLCSIGKAYRRTHDLEELRDSLADEGVPIPAEIDELIKWSTFAVTYRYEDLPASAGTERGRARTLVDFALKWAATFMPPPASP